MNAHNMIIRTCPVVSVASCEGWSGRMERSKKSLSVTGGSSTDEPTSRASPVTYKHTKLLTFHDRTQWISSRKHFLYKRL